MSIFGKRIKEARDSLGMNRTEFAEYVGSSTENISRYESGDMGVSLKAVAAIAEKLNINPGWFLGWSQEKYCDKPVEMKKIPIVGNIAAGLPILAQQNIEGYEVIDKEKHIDFCLRVKGDSMMGARIFDGDLVYIRQQPEVENGEIAVVIVGEEEATLKRFYKIDGNVVLRAENPKYKDVLFSKKELKNIKIIGKAICFKTEVQ